MCAFLISLLHFDFILKIEKPRSVRGVSSARNNNIVPESSFYIFLNYENLKLILYKTVATLSRPNVDARISYCLQRFFPSYLMWLIVSVTVKWIYSFRA